MWSNTYDIAHSTLVTEAEHNGNLYSQYTPHILPSQASSGVSTVGILEKKLTAL